MATTITTFKKARAGVEDLLFDSAGTSTTANTPTSAGGSRAVRKINASHLPITATTRAKTTAAGVTLDETNVDTALQQLFTDNAAQGIPDNSTLEVSGGVLRVKTGGIGATQIATGGVGTAEIAASVTLTTPNIGTPSAGVLTNCTGLPTAGLVDEAVTQPKLGLLAVENGNIAAATIKAAKLVDLPTYLPKLAGEYSWAGGATFIDATVTGVLDTDIVIASPFSLTNAVYMRSAAPTAANTIRFTFSADPGASVISYCVLRAVTP